MMSDQSPVATDRTGDFIVAPDLLRRVVIATACGNAMEWFDFGLYNYLAPTIGRVFFPSADVFVTTMATLGAFAVAFLARPIGAAVFGPLGDRIGRQRVLVITMSLMACATAAIGFIPSHRTIGIGAPILLLLARLLQGFSTGGEYGGAVTFIGEFSPAKRRGFMGSWLEFGTCAGFVLGAVAATLLLMTLPAAAVDSWGWRLPFLLAAPLGLIGLYIRLSLEETPAFRAVQRTPAPPPSRGVWWAQRRMIVLCIALVAAFNIPDFLILSYIPTYLSGPLHMPEQTALLLSTVTLLFMMALVPLGGWLSDIVGRRPMIFVCCGLHAVLAVPCFRLIASGRHDAVLTGLGIMACLLAGLIGTMPATLASLFPTRIRYGALAIAYNISICVLGATSLPIVHWLVKATGNPIMPGYYLIGSSVLGLIAAWFMTETAGKPLPEALPDAALPGAVPCAEQTRGATIDV